VSQISGAEYTFSDVGIFFHAPKQAQTPAGKQSITFKESIVLGVHEVGSEVDGVSNITLISLMSSSSSSSSSQGNYNNVHAIITRLRQDFPPGSYNVINHNCNNFADAFVRELIGVGIPSW